MGNQTARDFFWFYFSSVFPMKVTWGTFIVAKGNPPPPALNDNLDTIIIQFAAQNQRLCCRLLPMMVNTLHLATTQRNVILPTVTLVGAIVSENGRNFK